MEWFKCIQYCYSWSKYDNDDVRRYVELGKITAEQYKEITGEYYATPSERTSGTTDGSIGSDQVN
ncbi:XkdX family protein [Bacillus halotolerans]|uniref:XkdX family protein n=1 Tax=Bacillus halotolerans TaxID=260554 RepID=UPI000D032C43|nr:XkdX family protein [Bacillus halotolerans]PRS04369.1 XkdX family protein [Bacillus halotolerans]QKS03970.1 XkdX family protein [Bacillus halotolerans]